MRIGLVHPALDIKGGAENVVVWLAGGLARRGHDVTVLTSSIDRSLFGDSPLNFEVIELKNHGYELSWSGMRRAAHQLQPLLSRFDVINPHNFPANFWTYWALPSRQIPVVWFCQEPLRSLYRPPLDPHVRQLVERRVRPGYAVRVFQHWRSQGGRGLVRSAYRRTVLRRVKSLDGTIARSQDLILTNSAFVADQVRLLFGVQAEVCRLGIPIAENSVPVGTDRAADFELLTVSRLKLEKNVETILLAVARLPQEWRKRLRLTIVGAGPEYEALLALREHLDLGRNVVFTGAVSDEELDVHYRRCDAVVYLTLDETFGLVFPEAAARSKPSIAPDHGGPTEFVEHGRTGLLVDALDPEAVARGIIDLLRDRGRLVQMGDAALAKVKKDYTVDAMVDRYLGLLERMVRSKAGQPFSAPK